MTGSELTRWARHAGVAIAAWSLATVALADTVVPGTSNPKLAGMPDGTEASSGDIAPAQSPVLFAEFTILPGTRLQFTSVSGVVDNCGGSCSKGGPDGAQNEIWTNPAENGISGLTAPLNSLVGVFLGATNPSAMAAPDALDFSTTVLRSATTVAPALQQVFFIGDGLTGTGTGSGTVQSFLVPDGATRLYLATHDGYGWFNNSGSFTVTVTAVPEPASTALLLAGLGLVGVAARRRR